MRCPSVNRTYRATLVLELILLAMWIPPTYAIASGVASGVSSGAVIPNYSVATLVFCGLNL